jgi:hypothetical protein
MTQIKGIILQNDLQQNDYKKSFIGRIILMTELF